MKNLRIYGKPPFTLALIHGGPGAPGELAPMARELAGNQGVLEPFQTQASLSGQIEELKEVLENYGTLPVILAGFSWGAWLSFLFTAQYPNMIKKLILISSGSFREEYALDLEQIRLSRLSRKEQSEVESLIAVLYDPDTRDKNTAFARLGQLLSKADAYDPLNNNSEGMECQFDIFQSVWQDAEKLRKNGSLLQMGEGITCPVVAIHGDYDSHSAQGVEKPLVTVVKNFRFILLEKCGHKPWLERQAREEFFKVMREEISIKD